MRRLSLLIGISLVVVAVGYFQFARRSQMDGYLDAAVVAQGLQAGAAIRVRVEEYYWSTGAMPADNAKLGMPAPELVAPPPVRSVTVMRGGVIHVEFDGTLGEGSSLTLFPAVARGSDRIDWACSLRGIDAEQLNLIRPPCVRTPQSPIGDLMLAIQRGDAEAVRRLLAQGVAVNQHFQGDRPLPAAVDRGRVEIARLLLEAGADPDQSASYYNGQTPLMVAAAHGNLPMIRLLLEHGARPDRRDRHGKAALDYAAPRGTRQEVYRVLAMAASGEAPAVPGGGEPLDPLMAAVMAGSREQVEAALADGALDREDRRGDTALFHALRRADNGIAVRLIDAGADVNHRNLRGETALMLAAERGDVDLVKRLIAAGADVDPAPENGDSPLIRAVRSQHVAAAEQLLGAGADAKRNASAALVELISAPAAPPVALVEQMLAGGADGNARDRSGVPVLVVALRLGYREAAIALLARGAAARGDSKGIAQPIVMAASAGDTGLVEALLAAGADVNATDRSGRTPLHAAVDGHAFHAVKLLLQHGADPDREDGQGVSPREIATAKYYQNILQLFESATATVR